jgi:tetratricopeptide (TPR) repeat protein
LDSVDQEIQKLEEILDADRDPAGRSFVPLADAYRRSGDLDRAFDVLSEGLSAHPDFTSAHVVAGWLHLDSGAPQEAIRSFEVVMDLDPENVAALRGVADALEALGSYAEAAEYLRQLNDLEPVGPEVRERIEHLESLGSVEVPGSEEAPSAGIDHEEVSGAEDLSREAGDLAVELEAALPPGEEPGPRSEMEAVAQQPLRVLDSDLEGTEGVAVDPFAELGVDSPDELPAIQGEESLAEPGSEEPTTFLGPTPEEGAPVVDPDLLFESMETLPAPLAPSASEGLEDDWSAEGEEVYTETMGELYADQGLLHRAAEVFRHLLEREPENARYRERLAELESMLAPARDEAAGGAEEADFEVHLASPAWVRDSDQTADVSTPFAWTEEEGEAEEEASADERLASGYFEDLLAWVPGAVPIEQLAPGQPGDVAEVVESAAESEGSPARMIEAPGEVQPAVRESGSEGQPERATEVDSAPEEEIEEADSKAQEPDEDFQEWLRRLGK